MRNILKAYTKNEDCYCGNASETFECQFMLFNQRCKPAGIPEEDRTWAFSILLCGSDGKFYFEALAKKCGRHGTCAVFKNRCQTLEWTSALLQELDAIFPKQIISISQEKSTSAALKIFLQNWQISKPRWHWNTETTSFSETSNLTLYKPFLRVVWPIKSGSQCSGSFLRPACTLFGWKRAVS